MNRPSPAGPRPLTAILAGPGGAGEDWLSALSGPGARTLGVELAGLCEPDPGRASEVLRRRGLSLPVHESLSEALATGPDLVVDCTTANARLAMAREALLSGAHVLCPGPLAGDEQTAAQLLGAAARAGRHLAVSQPLRLEPGVRQLRDLVRAGTLGTAQTLLADLHMAPRFGDHRDGMRHAMLRGPALHAFDAARAILGADALTVACLERTPAGQPFAHGPEVHATFEMSDGALFVFHGNWAEEGPPSSWNARWRLALSAGAARWDGEGEAQAWAPADAGAPGPLPESRPQPLPPAEPGPTGPLGSLAALLGAIRAGAPPETQARDNALSLAMMLAAIRSAENGGRPEPVRRLGDLADATGLSGRPRVPARET